MCLSPNAANHTFLLHTQDLIYQWVCEWWSFLAFDLIAKGLAMFKLGGVIDAQKCKKFVIFLLPLNPFNELKYKKKYLFAGFHGRYESMIKKIIHLGRDRA